MVAGQYISVSNFCVKCFALPHCLAVSLRRCVAAGCQHNFSDVANTHHSLHYQQQRHHHHHYECRPQLLCAPISRCSCVHSTTAYRKCQSSDVFCNAPGGLAPSDGSRLAGPCVPKEKRCDGYLDCRNGRDEEGCTGISCRLDQFRCANGQKCIDASLKCNHKDDCGDKSDEQGCSKYSIVKSSSLQTTASRYSRH